jgi:hypothetical protein
MDGKTLAQSHPDAVATVKADDNVEGAASRLLIALAFLVPPGTDLTTTIGPELVAYRDAILARERALVAERATSTSSSPPNTSASAR